MIGDREHGRVGRLKIRQTDAKLSRTRPIVKRNQRRNVRGSGNAGQVVVATPPLIVTVSPAVNVVVSKSSIISPLIPNVVFINPVFVL